MRKCIYIFKRTTLYLQFDIDKHTSICKNKIVRLNRSHGSYQEQSL